MNRLIEIWILGKSQELGFLIITNAPAPQENDVTLT